MITHSRTLLVTLILPVCSQALAGGLYWITPAQADSHYEYCAYPLCDPAHGSISGESYDGTTLEILREETYGYWYMVISGFTSNPGSNYVAALDVSCEGPAWFRSVYPYYSYYGSGSLYVYLHSYEPYANRCWSISDDGYQTSILTN